jgi:hypothetical protein
VIECEKKKLADAGRADLAAKVIWVSKDIGDGYGYDVSSFTCDGEQILIEIKTINGAKTSPFYISEAELAMSEIEEKKYRLYRVFDFARKPHIFELNGPLRHRLSLSVASYRATVG